MSIVTLSLFWCSKRVVSFEFRFPPLAGCVTRCGRGSYLEEEEEKHVIAHTYTGAPSPAGKVQLRSEKTLAMSENSVSFD